MTPAVSVVIPAYNAAATIGETLKALSAQAGAPPAEIIVVDNASTDETGRIAGNLGARVLFESQRGPAAARNCGIAAAQAPLIAHLDADTVPSRRWLAQLVAPLAGEATMIAAGNTLCYPPQTPAERYVHESGLYDTQRAIGRSVFPFAPSLNMAVRREAAIAAGGWNAEMQTGEDVDFSHRVLKRFGGTIAYAEGAVLYHRVRATDDALARQAWTYGEGAADLYRRYPGELPWTPREWARLAGTLAARNSLGAIAPVARSLGLLDARRAEYHRYNALWTTAFWSGFLSLYRSGGRRAWT